MTPKSLLPLPLLLCAALASCTRRPDSTPSAPKVEAACRQTLPPRSAPRPALAPVVPADAVAAEAAPSRLIVEARLPLARLAAELERSLGTRLAEETGVKLGPAGVLRYSVDRGAISVSTAGDQLVIETPLQARAEACSGRRCYAACEPAALARVELPLWLRPDYRFDGSRLGLEFTRGCRVRALGGLLSVDVTPILKSALAPQLERVRREIDARLPDPRAHVERAWQQLSTPRELPLLGCVALAPLGLVQGPLLGSGDVLQARFALLARPELLRDCGGAPAASALPPLGADPALPAEDVVTLGMEVPLGSLARAFQTAPPADPAARLRVDRATVGTQGSGVAAELTLSGELCGTLALRAEPSFGGEEGVLGLSAGQLEPGESERVRAAGADPAALVQQLTQRPRFPPPLPLPVLRAAPSALASLFSDPELALRTRVSALRAAGASARAGHLVAWVEARGSLLLEPK